MPGRAEDYVDLIIDEMIPRITAQNLAEFCDIFCESKVFNLDQARRVLTAAKTHGLGLRMHADQFTSFGASDLAAELGAATCDHLEQNAARIDCDPQGRRRSAGPSARIRICHRLA